MRVGQRSVGVEFDEHMIDVRFHEIARQPANAQRCGAMRAGRAAHDRSDDVVEDADHVALAKGHSQGAEIDRTVSREQPAANVALCTRDSAPARSTWHSSAQPYSDFRYSTRSCRCAAVRPNVRTRS